MRYITYKTIQLTTGENCIVDEEDYEYLNQFKWLNRGGYAGTVKVIKGKQITKLMHRMILNITGKEIIDHYDKNPFNNRKSNLRICDKSKNAMNCKIHKHNTSGYKGVSKSGNKWRAYIVLKDKQYHIGCFTTKKEAALAYNKRALELFKEFASLNVIKD